ncbi:hypothetical protein C9374_006164 [Naegleria lovaniensis]|uniref:Uncharacterized protein n=1 Tax=Naegleria lovaniensis TaxID=51637 RepID=A0AA88GPN7_NAELO|nr:uncharacterized protein C9374_006164 [Naegleria lovaniensis]KAG2381780.1 hypothetical protein C9374_006164 [Naegleria lovaniensis]
MLHHQRRALASGVNKTNKQHTSPIAIASNNTNRQPTRLDTSSNHDEGLETSPEERINSRIKTILKKLPSKKEDNPIKFKSFYECIKDVKIISDVQYDTRRREDSKDESDTTTFLYDKMLEWDELNLTKHYIMFRTNVQSFVRTLPEMLHHKEKICDIFIHHLRIKDSLAFQPLLDLVTIFAKDLRQEFYPLLPRLFYPIVYNISSTNTELNALIFKSLAFLFKYLQKYILKDISLWFEKYSKILSHKKWYIRKFAAESFSFLINKLSDSELKEYVRKTFELLISKPSQNMYDGTSQMFFESMKGVLGNYHSKMPRLLPLLFRQLDWNEESNDTIKKQLSDIGNKFTLVEKCLILLRDYSKNKEVAKQVWDLLVKEFEYLIQVWRRTTMIHDQSALYVSLQIGHAFQLIRVFTTSVERCDEESILKVLKCVNHKELISEMPSQTAQALFSFITDIVDTMQRSDLIENSHNLLYNCFFVKDKQTVYTFYKKLMTCVGTEEESNTIVKEFLRFVNSDIEENMETTVSFLLNFIHTNLTDENTFLEYSQLSEKNSKFVSVIQQEVSKRLNHLMKMNQEQVNGYFSSPHEHSHALMTWGMLNVLSTYGKKSEQYSKQVYQLCLLFLNQFIPLIEWNTTRGGHATATTTATTMTALL